VFSLSKTINSIGSDLIPPRALILSTQKRVGVAMSVPRFGPACIDVAISAMRMEGLDEAVGSFGVPVFSVFKDLLAGMFLPGEGT
jgi:hypothetical protein